MTDKEAAARDWLNRNKWREDEIKELELKLEIMRDNVNKTISPPQEIKVQTQPRNKRGEQIAEIVDFEKQIEEKRRYYAALQDESVKTICRLRDATKKTILVYRYIIGLSWKEISKKTHYTESYLYDMHLRALADLYQYIDFSQR